MAWPIKGPGVDRVSLASSVPGLLTGISASLAQPPWFSRPVFHWAMLQ